MAIIVIVLSTGIVLAQAAYDAYTFSRSYITALSFRHNIDSRWSQMEKLNKTDNLNVIKSYIDFLIKDNADWRIAKNYMTKYITSQDPLVRKIADTFILSCERNIALNDQAKKLWMSWEGLLSSGQATPQKERQFVQAHEAIGFARKESDKTLIEASILLTKYLTGYKEDSYQLIISDEHRKLLVKKLDSFAKDNMDWGLKPGQSTSQACVAVIREVLEDALYVSANQ